MKPQLNSPRQCLGEALGLQSQSLLVWWVLLTLPNLLGRRPYDRWCRGSSKRGIATNSQGVP